MIDFEPQRLERFLAAAVPVSHGDAAEVGALSAAFARRAIEFVDGRSVVDPMTEVTQ